MKFLQAATGWKPRAWSSFDSIVSQVMEHRRGNMHLARKHKWALDQASIENEVDQYNSAVCERMGWTDYIMQPPVEAPPPKFKALSPFSEKHLSAVADKVKKVWQGVRSLNDWIDSEAPAVDAPLAQKRAEVCAACPINGQGGLEEWFTKPASEIIKRQFQKVEARKLMTTVDDKLNVCTACLCPLKLLVHVPLDFKLAHMNNETRNALDSHCWILDEERARSGS